MRKILFVLMGCLFGNVFSSILITPSRVILTESSGGAYLKLLNTSKEEARYRIALKDMEMDELGNINEVEVYEHSLKKFIRFSPRFVNLAPGSTQTVRIGVRFSEHMPDGEYRSHLGFTWLNPANYSESDIRLNANVTITIPIILRKGSDNNQLTMNDIVLTEFEDKKVYSIDFVKIGDFSVYGKLQSCTQTDKEPVMLLNAFSIYRESHKRKVIVPEANIMKLRESSSRDCIQFIEESWRNSDRYKNIKFIQ